MTDPLSDAELDLLLAGDEGLAVPFIGPDGSEIVARFDRHALRSPVAWRATMRRALGHTGYRAPVHSQEDHDEIVRAMFALAELA